MRYNFFLEIYSEEIPYLLQVSARDQLLKLAEKDFRENNIDFRNLKCLSTPKRLVLLAEEMSSKILIPSKLIKGPRVGCKEETLAGFMKSQSLIKNDLFEQDTEKGKFYFFKSQKKDIDTKEVLQSLLGEFLSRIQWKKSMKWGSYDCYWGRPIISLACMLDEYVVNFSYNHLVSKNIIYLNGPYDDKEFKIKNSLHYLETLKKNNIILDHDERKKIISENLKKFLLKNGCHEDLNNKLLDEVTNLVEQPYVIKGNFKKDFLDLPSQLLDLTMQYHQKYFTMKLKTDDKHINYFLFVSNNKDINNLILSGNEKVLQARLFDAKFFWDKNKKQNLVKQISKLKKITFFQKLGTMYDRTQRIRQLSSIIADLVDANKSEAEIAGSIAKADLVSDLVIEFPELQGVIGSHFATQQGFSEEVSNAIKDHYLPIGPKDNVPRSKVSISVALADKIDVVLGFYGINEKPTSSKDPFALRRNALGIIRILIKNKISLSLKEIFNNAKNLYKIQNINLVNENLTQDLNIFFLERLKIILRDFNFRSDVINSIFEDDGVDDIYRVYNKVKILDNLLKQNSGKIVTSVYKRAKNIIDQNSQDDIFGNPDKILFEHPSEDEILIKINEIKDYFTTPSRLRDYNKSIQLLSEIKPLTDTFFDQVKVNNENQQLKKNRLELLYLMCKTFDKFTDFSKLDGTQ